MSLVPTREAKQNVVLANGNIIDIDNTQFFPILFGGDQVTVARVRGTQALRDTHDNPVDRLQGIILVVEDWHA